MLRAHGTKGRGNGNRVCKVDHVLRTIVIALTAQYPKRQPSLYDYASRPSTLR